MTAWQMMFIIIPKKSIIEYHGQMIERISYFSNMDEDDELPPFVKGYSADNYEMIDYWGLNRIKFNELEAICKKLNFQEIYEHEKIIYHDNWNTVVEFYNEYSCEIQVKFDIRKLNFIFLNIIINWCKSNDFVLISFHDGRVLIPDIDSVLSEFPRIDCMKLSEKKSKETLLLL